MARHTSRMGLVTMIASALRTTARPGSTGLIERAAAVPRMLSAIMRGEYRGTTFGHLAVLAAAVTYILSPIDFMPEALFAVFGLADDAVVVTWLVAALVNDTEAFLAWEAMGGREQATAPQDWSHSGPQDMSAQEYDRVVQSRVIR